ncbi:MAG: hypothetical protein RSD89_06705, partial [Mucinivorans sp.]
NKTKKARSSFSETGSSFLGSIIFALRVAPATLQKFLTLDDLNAIFFITLTSHCNLGVAARPPQPRGRVAPFDCWV